MTSTLSQPPHSMTKPRLPTLRICRGCGCNDLAACAGGCSWVLLDVATPTGVCSQCAKEWEWNPDLMHFAVRDESGEIFMRDDFGGVAETISPALYCQPV
jgi:hypothetical protein